MMKPCGIRIWSNRLEETRKFYTEVLPFKVKIDGSDKGWIIVGTPSIDLILEKDDGSESSRYLGVSLQVEDIHSTYENLIEKGVEFVCQPSQQEWGGWLADFKDNTGNVLTLLQNPK